MTNAYDPKLRELALRCAATIPIELREGVYAGLLGPSYETPAEVRMLARLGADAVGMSTVHETIALRDWGVRVVEVSVASQTPAPESRAVSSITSTCRRLRTRVGTSWKAWL